MTKMIKTILFFITVSPIISLGQEIKKVKKEYVYPSYKKEVYYVLKSDKSIRHGSYQELGKEDELIIDGFYKNGLKDSIWTEYSMNGKYKKTNGKYLDGKKVGVWEYYNSKGELEQKYDYTNNEVVYYKLDYHSEQVKYNIIIGSDTMNAKLDQPPFYIGGSETLRKLIFKNIQSPQKAKDNKVSGTVYVSFTIDCNGKTSNHRVIKGFGYGCDEEALRVVKGIPDDWIPGVLDGKPVIVENVIPISFKFY